MNKKTTFFVLISLMSFYILITCYLDYNIKRDTKCINDKYIAIERKAPKSDSNKYYGYASTLNSLYGENALEIVSINNSENEKDNLLNVECDFHGRLQVFIKDLENIKDKENFNNIKFISIKKEDINNISAKVKLEFLKEIK